MTALSSALPIAPASISATSEKNTRNSSLFSAKSSKKPAKACSGRAMAFLRALHPVKTAEAIEAATGGFVSADRARKWIAGATQPDFKATMVLISVYGPDFLSAALDDPPHWLMHATRAERLAALEAEQIRLAREIEAITRG